MSPSARTYILDCGTKTLDLSVARVMGIINCTPDSFSDGDEYPTVWQGFMRARQMVREGVAIIDVGGESTRPGAHPVAVEQEMERVVPLIEKLTAELDIPVSIDTSQPEVMRAAVAAGAVLINDVRALRAPHALETVADLNRDASIPVCVMHMQGDPATMQVAPQYDDVLAEVGNFLNQRVAACVAAGIPADRLLIDPGFGFGKTREHNLELLRRLDALTSGGLPVLVGMSRKAMMSAGDALRGPKLTRMHKGFAGLAAAVLAAERGARLIRTHDVGATVIALRMFNAVAYGDRHT